MHKGGTRNERDEHGGTNAHAQSSCLVALWPHLLMKYVTRELGVNREEKG
jgi:hypothetical protein